VQLKTHFLCKYKTSLNEFFCMNIGGIQQLWHIKAEREREDNSSDE
jgi:polyphosphate kinase